MTYVAESPRWRFLRLASRRAALPMLGVLVVSILSAAGCRPEASAPEPAASAPSMDGAINRDSPQQAVSSLMTLLRAQLEAAGRADLVAASSFRDQVAWYIVDRSDVTARYRALGLRRPLGEVEMIAKLADNWASIISYYADGLELDRMETTVAVDGTSAAVRLPVSGPDNRAVLVIACKLDDQEEWRVLMMEFAPSTDSGQPADSQPATSVTIPG